jgi:hypothetical protein
MLRAWRRAAIAALAGAAALAAQFAVIAPAQAAAPTITINATTLLPQVAKQTGDALVVYHGPRGSGKATIHGKITGAAAGEVAALYGQQFPYKKPAVRLGAVTLKSSAPVYSFPVAPALATRYVVRLFANSTAKSALATSAVKNVYVTPLGSITFNFNCPRPQCHLFVHLKEFVPSSALSTEMGKHFYKYFAVTLSATNHNPPFPKILILNAGHPVLSGLRKVNSGEFAFTLEWTFTVGNDFFSPLPTECQKDSLTKDGLGLPGSHGCGATKLSTSQFYVG